MLRHRIIKELSGYLDNQLSEKEKLKVEAHLKDCELCQKELSRLKQLSEKLKSWHVPELGPFFADTVKRGIAHQGVERGATKMNVKKWYLVPSGILAGFLVLAFFSQVYVRRAMVGRVKESSNSIGRQFDPSGGYQTAWQTQSKSSDKQKQYEPYYLNHGAYEMAKVRQKNDAFGSAGSSELLFEDKDGEARYYERERKQELADSDFSRDYQSPVELQKSSEQTVSTQGRPVIVVEPSLPATGVGDKIIRTAEVILEVEDAGQANTKISAICQELGGYLAASSFHKNNEGKQAGTITMRVPKDKFLDALNKINSLGKVENSSTQSQDVSQEYTNLNNQLNITMIIYNKMMEALQKRQVTIPEAMYMESELTPVLRRVEDLKNKIEYLNNAISFTTITVQFHEPSVSLKVLKDSKQDIQKSMLAATIGAIQFLAKAIPITVAVVIWLAIILIIVVVLKNWVVRLLKR